MFLIVSGLSIAKIIPENAGNGALSPLSENFDEELFLEEVRKYINGTSTAKATKCDLYMKQSAWIQVSAVLKRDGKFNSNKSLLRLNAAILILYSPSLAIFGCGEQRAIRANYFAAKKSASREKIRNWKTGFMLFLWGWCNISLLNFTIYSTGIYEL